MKTKLIALLFSICVSGAAFADCEYNASKYPEGTSVGPYVCVGDQWIHQ